MNPVAVDSELVEAAIELVRERFGDEAWAGAAAVRLDDGAIVTSTAPDSLNDSVALCHETGALCEAFKLGKRVVASVCVTLDPEGRFLVLAPCGVCQERLFLYGPDVEVGVGQLDGSWQSTSLAQLQPHYWRNVLPEG
jgi:cytidine deaminase